MPTISEQIAGIATKLAENKATLEALTKSLDDKPGDATILAQVDSLSGAIEIDAKMLTGLQRAEKALADRSAPVPGSPAILPFRPKVDKLTFDHLLRAAVVAIDCHYSHRPVDTVLAERYGADPLTRDLCVLQLNGANGLELLTRAAQSPANTTTATYAAELVQLSYAAFQQALVGISAWSQTPWRDIGNFDNGAPIVVPFRNQRAAFPDDLEAAFRREGDPIRVGRLSTGSKQISPYQMSVIGTFTKELLRRSTPNIEALIRQAMLDDTAEILDGVIFGAAAAAAGVRPAGLTNGIAAQDTAASTGATPDAIHADLQKRVKQLVAVRRLGGPSTRWIMNTANAIHLSGLMSGLNTPVYGNVSAGAPLAGYPVAHSIYFPLDQVLLVDAGAIPMIGGQPLFEASDQATLHEENTTPLPIGTAGTPAVVAAPVRSLWQTHSAALKMNMEISWDQLRVGAVQQITAVAW